MVASALFGSNFTVLRINVIFARGCGLVSCHFGFDADGRPVSSNHKEDARKNWWAGILLGIFGEEFITSDVGGDLGARLVAFSYLCGIGKGRVGRAKRKRVAEEKRLAEEKKLTIAIAEASQSITPERQKEFLDIISTYAEKYTNTKNEMKKSLQRKKRVKAFKEFFSSGLGFEYWGGTITSIDTDKDGDADVSIDIGGITLNNVTKKIK